MNGLGARASSSALLLGFAMLLAGSGCATSLSEYVHNGFKVGPNYLKPAAPVSERWIDSEDARVSNEPPQNWAWWRVFNDPVLDGLVQTAHAQNLTLREAGFRVIEARAIRGFTVGNLFPQQQEAFGSYMRIQRSLESNLGLGGGAGGAGGGAGGFSIPRRFDLWQLGGQLAWELDFWGRFRRAVEAADAELDATVEDYDDVLVILCSDVASTYVEIRTLEQRIRYARSNVHYQEGSLEIAEVQEAEGVATRLDIAQAQTNVAQTAAAIPLLETQLRHAENRLCVLMGIPPQELPQLLAGTSRIPTAPPQVAIGVPADLIRRRPDVRRAEREVAAQSARIGIAEAELYPAFTISGSIFLEANRFENLFKSTAVAGNVGPSFNWNILNYGRILNLIRVEEARFQQEVAQYQNVVLNANREAEDALVAFLLAQEQARILRQGVIAAEESRDLVSALYRGGRADFGRVFFAEFFLVQQQDAYAQAEGAIAQALVNLYRALGGGWQLRLQPLPPLAVGPVVPIPAAEPLLPAAADPEPLRFLPPPADIEGPSLPEE